MNRDIGGILRPLLAIVLFAVVVWQTASALRVSGVWGRAARAVPAAPDDPFVTMDRMLGAPGAAALPAPRDPFSPNAAPMPVVRVARPRPAAAPAQPVLTAIVWDNDPRALVRWRDREWTVRSGGLFDEFQVLGITRDKVTLARGSETIVLQRQNRGD